MNTLILNRRRFLGLAAGASAAGVLPPSVYAQSTSDSAGSIPPAGVFATQLGEWKITALLDGIIPLQKGYFSGDQVAIDAVLSSIGREDGSLPAPINAFLLEGKGRTILIDAGMGAIDGFGPGFGQVRHAKHAAGVTPDSIDTVVITHAHPDHLGGVLTQQGEAVFTKAELILSQAELDFWGSEENLSQAPDEAKGIFQFAQNAFAVYTDRINPVDSGTEIAPGLTLEVAAGHTPGHSILRIDTGDQSVVMVADLFHSAELHTALPDLGFGFDIDPQQAAATRKALFAQFAEEKTLIIGSHAHFPGFGRILSAGDAYRYVPVTV